MPKGKWAMTPARKAAYAKRKKKGGGASDKAKSAYVKAYKGARKLGSSKGWAKRTALLAAHGKSKKWAGKKADAYAKGVAKKQFKIKSKSGRSEFSRGYKRTTFGR